MKTAEYYITKFGTSGNFFKIVKFEGGTEPTNVYLLTMKRKGEWGYDNNLDPAISTDLQFHCDCPNRRRGKHVNDKHGVMVVKWLLAGCPAGHFDQNGEFHGSQAAAYERDLAGEEHDNERASDRERASDLDGLDPDDDSDEEGEGH